MINSTNIGLLAIKGMQELENYVENSGMEKLLIELIRLRVSQLNGCHSFVGFHSEDALQMGESHKRLDNLSSWRQKEIYSDREKAALGWTEALTLIAQYDISDVLYEEVRRSFDEKEIIILTIAINSINSWNRLAISFRIPAKAKPILIPVQWNI